MGSVSPAAAAGWTAEDDLLLKAAVEAGASLQSLAKGAARFSHKFTLQELQDRWYSLLYDSETSAQASARMADYETELLTYNPAKACKMLNSMAKGFPGYKRKIDSVKVQYHARIKRVCHEPCLSADLGFGLVPCSCVQNDGGGCACGCRPKCSEDHQFVHEINSPSGGAISSYGCKVGSDVDRQHVPSNGNEHLNIENDHSDGRIMFDGDSNHGSLKGYSEADQLYGYDYMQKNPQTRERNIVSTGILSDHVNVNDAGATGSKALPSIDQDGVNHDQLSWHSAAGLLEPGSFDSARGRWCSQAPGIPSWSKLLGVSSPELTDVHSIEQEIPVLADGKMGKKNNDALAFRANLGGFLDSCLGNATVSAVGFMHSSLKGFCKKEYLDHFSSGHVLHSTLDTNHENVGDSQTKDLPKACSGDVQCILNTEDSEIPFSDHIPIPDQSSLLAISTLKQDSQHDMCLVPTKVMNMENVVPSPLPPPPLTLEPAIEQQKECVVGNLPPVMHCGSNNANMHTKSLHSVDEGEGTTCGLFQRDCCDNLQKLALDKSIQVPNQMSCKLHADKAKIGCETAIQNHTMSHALLVTQYHNPVASMSTPAQAEGSDSENSIPDYLDIEALILEQDLIPWDQESDVIQPEVSRFCSPEGGKDLMKLEKGAYSSMNRSIMSKGAFAIIYGKHLIYYIRDTEVTLGRETGEVHVDIDLGKEGNANKISRRQAVIKMDSGGSFYMTNIGKGSIFVNGKEVPCSKRILLTSDSLIEIRNLRFMFHVNDAAVRKHIIRAMRESSQGNNTTFDWNQNA